MKKRATWLKLAVILAIGSTTAYAFSSGPPASRTGAPGEGNCTECHIGDLNPGGGRVRILGVPEQYAPNQELTLTVQVEHSSRSRWGFQITALDSQNRPTGIFTLVDDRRTRFSQGSGQFAGRVYVNHTSQGTFAGQAGSAEWEVRWTAPGQDVGRITFYAVGNAANNNDQSSGDSIFTTSVTTGTSTPTIVAPAFKKGKIVLQANGSNIEQGATLEVSGSHLSQTETFTLARNSAGTKWLVKKSARSTPGNLTANDVLPVGATITLVVKNPNGTASASATLSR